MSKELEKQDGILEDKKQVEAANDDLKAECVTLKMTNEEYRKTLLTKNKELNNFIKDIELYKKSDHKRTKEMNFVQEQSSKKITALSIENE
mmetsp:Transcript_2139/g.1478  ORF Transcript_2139/g.1478 Transcript_2139/m.1478 type:complete len:91 (+) Transcript_2139:1274-1546(+)